MRGDRVLLGFAICTVDGFVVGLVVGVFGWGC
jgi:ABC-type nitrate/sulfonate/bicarbonate transport system permease component